MFVFISSGTAPLSASRPLKILFARCFIIRSGTFLVQFASICVVSTVRASLFIIPFSTHWRTISLNTSSSVISCIRCVRNFASKLGSGNLSSGFKPKNHRKAKLQFASSITFTSERLYMYCKKRSFIIISGSFAGLPKFLQ